jgi:hypothetical protein
VENSRAMNNRTPTKARPNGMFLIIRFGRSCKALTDVEASMKYTKFDHTIRFPDIRIDLPLDFCVVETILLTTNLFHCRPRPDGGSIGQAASSFEVDR